ncbi:unnamed protein product [Spodoptera exigua]|nr:unnamed protein product [Spodoptera exigua]
MMSAPPGCSSKKLVMSYTRSYMTTQQSCGESCSLTSARVIVRSLASGAPGTI